MISYKKIEIVKGEALASKYIMLYYNHILLAQEETNMKKWKVTVVSALAIFSLAACNGKDTSKDVVVSMKGKEITQEQLFKELKNEYGDTVLSEMIQKQILEDKYKVSDKELNERLNFFKKTFGVEKDDDFENYIKTIGQYKSLKEFKDKIRENMMQVKAVTDGVKVADKDVNALYETRKSQIKASHILVKDEAQAKEIYDKIQKGAKFEDMVKQYSTDTQSALNKGSLGFFSKGTMDADFEKVAFGLEKGKMSEPVKTSFGYHIIRLDDKRDIPLEELKPMLEEELKLKQAQPLDSVIQKLMKDYKVEFKDKDLEKKIQENAKSQLSQ